MISIEAAIIFVLLGALIFGSGFEFAVCCLLSIAFFWLAQGQVSAFQSLLLLSALLLPIPLAAYLLGTCVDEMLPIESRKIVTALIVSITLAALAQSGFFEESLILLAETKASLGKIQVATLFLAALSGSMFCALIVAGTVTFLVAVFELTFSYFFSVPRDKNRVALPSFGASLRPYLLLGFLAFSSNLTITLFISKLRPLSLLKFAGV